MIELSGIAFDLICTKKCTNRIAWLCVFLPFFFCFLMFFFFCLVCGHSRYTQPTAALLDYNMDGPDCLATEWVSDSQMRCQVHPGMGPNKKLRVVVGEQASEPLPKAFDYDGPTVLQAAPDHGPTEGGTNITITGTNFGGRMHIPTVMVGARVCRDVYWHSSERLSCVTPAGTGALLGITVQILDQSSQPLGDPYKNNEAFSYDAPRVTAVVPNHCAGAGGCVVVITGSNFGTELRGRNNDNPLNVTIGGRPCVWSDVEDGDSATVVGYSAFRGHSNAKTGAYTGNHSTWLTHHELRCRVPEGLGLRNAIVVLVDGLTSPPVPLFNYHQPVVLGVEPNHSPPKGGARLVIRGFNFGAFDPAESAVSDAQTPTMAWVGGLPCS